MEFIIKPPLSFDSKGTEFIEEDVYSRILSNYKDSDLIFKIIKENGVIKNLTRKDCTNLSVNFALEIEKKIKHKKNEKQIRIMAIIGASEESVIFMLSSLYLGAHHCICFEDLSSEAIRQRLTIFKPDLIVCKNKLVEKVKLALTNNNGIKIPIINININQIENLDLTTMKASNYKKDHSLFTLFTSGSTGKPKAIIHGVSGYLKYAEFTTKYFFGIRKFSKIFTAVDAGWINGHTYAFYGPLLLGGISVINEIPTLISIPRILGEYLNKIKPDCFYTSVTLLRLLKSMTKNNENLSSYVSKNYKLERIGSCGEPLANQVGEWAYKFFKPKRKSIVNTYFQTETGGIIVAPRDEDLAPKDYSCVGKPRKELGLFPAKYLINKGQLLKEKIQPNELLIKNPWQGIFQSVISDKKSNYFTKDGYFRLHDVGYIDEDGYLYIGGRSDDVINISGHRISTSEIESICLDIDLIKEACAVSCFDKLSGEKIVLFYTPLKKNINNDEIIFKLKKTIQNKLTKYHLPSKFETFNELPKTQSGKIMRRIMRDLANKNAIDESLDYSTLANKESFLKSKDIFINSIKGN